MNETEQRDNTHGEAEEKARFGPSSPDFTPSGDSSDPRGADNIGSGKSSDPRAENSIKAREAAAGVSSRGAVGKDESRLSSNKLGKGYTGTPGGARGLSPASNVGNFLGKHKKKTLGGVFAGMIASVIFFLLTVGQGPLELIHLAQILQKNYRGQENSSEIRTKGLLRFAKTGELGETRVNKFGSKRVNAVLDQLKETGIEFPDRTPTGRLKTMTIDPQAENSPYKGWSDDAIRSDLGLPDDSSIFRREGAKLVIKSDPATLKGMRLQRMLSKTFIGTLGDGKINTALNVRWFSRFFGIESLFHPIRASTRVATEALIKKFGSKEGSAKAEEERAKPRTEAIKGKFGAARAKLGEKLNGKESLISKGLLVTAGLCLVRDVADSAIEVNRGIVLASTVEAVDKEAVGSQTQSGDDIEGSQAGTVANSLRDDKGKSVFDGQALDATAHEGAGKGEDIPASYSQAFSPDTTANNIRGTVKLEAAGVDISDITCSTPGLIIQGLANLALVIAAAPSGGASLAVYAGEQTAGTAATIGITKLLTKQFTKLLSSDAIVEAPVRGALGGNILAYGAREAANLAARAAGGIRLSPAASLAMDQQFDQQDKQQFQSESFFARLFDTEDYRSMASQTIDGFNPDPAQNVSHIASVFTNFGSSIFSNIFSLLTPKASAAIDKTAYDWPFPRYGIPQSLLNDPNYEDPYKNADKAIITLDSSKGDDYRDKAKTCFAADINNDSGFWDVKPTDEDINPNDQDYIDAHCDDLSDPNWKRIILFVFDTKQVQSIDCYEGDDDACSTLGIKDTGATTAPTESAGATIDIGHLYDSSVGIACAPGTADLGVQDGYTDGKKVKIRICGIPNLPGTGEESNDGYGVKGAHGKAVVNSRVSGAVLAMVAAAKDDGVNLGAGSAFRTMAHQEALCPCDGVNVAHPGYSNHQMGLAIDFNGIDKQQHSGPYWDWLSKNAKDFGYKNYPAEAWHWSPTGH